jgi:hypothetical protein
MAKATSTTAVTTQGSAVKAGTLTTRQYRVLGLLAKAGKAGLYRTGKNGVVGLTQLTGWAKGWAALMGAPSKPVQGPKTMQALGLTHSTVIGGNVHCTITAAGTKALNNHNKQNGIKATK